MLNRKRISTLITAIAGSMTLLISGGAHAASLTFNDLEDGTIDIFTGQFEGGFIVNGQQIAPPGPAGSVSGSILGVSEADGPITFSGTWIDLGQAVKESRTIYLVDPVDNSLVRDIFQITVSDAGGISATISGTWTSSLSGPLGPIPPGTAAANIRIEDGNAVGFSYAFLGARLRSTPDPDPVSGGPFSIIVLPDSQFYSENFPEVIEAQIDWIVANQVAENIIYVAQLGDLKDDATCDDRTVSVGTGGGRTEWQIVSDAYADLDTAGIPYSVVPGNHDFDQVGGGCPNWTNQRPLVAYNANFGPPRFAGAPWYGDPGVPTPGNRVASSNEDNFTLFGFGGVNFISINLAYKQGANPAGMDAEVTWANNLLSTYSDRLGIVTSHYLVEENPGDAFGPYGQEIYDGLSGNPNLFMMLSAHERGEAWRTDSTGRDPMQPVQAILADYQDYLYPTSTPVNYASLAQGPRSSGGNSGFMRIMRFDTTTGMVNVETFAPPVPELSRATTIVSDYFPADGNGMDNNSASNFSFSYLGYVTP